MKFWPIDSYSTSHYIVYNSEAQIYNNLSCASPVYATVFLQIIIIIYKIVTCDAEIKNEFKIATYLHSFIHKSFYKFHKSLEDLIHFSNNFVCRRVWKKISRRQSKFLIIISCFLIQGGKDNICVFKYFRFSNFYSFW